MQTTILTSDAPALEQTLNSAVDLLSKGEVVAIPTETVYGLAGHAFDENAVAKIFAAKERPRFDPLIVHLAHRDGRDLAQLGAEKLIDPAAVPQSLHAPLNALMKAFWPGPLTLVLPRAARVPELVTAGLETVALRVPAHPLAQALLQRSFPLAAPSANRFGRISPTSAQAVFQELGGRIPLILDGGPCEIGLESTVVGLEGEQLCLLRPGRLGLDELSAVAGTQIRIQSAHPAEIRAPGMLKSHYAPASRLYLTESRDALPALLAAHSGRPGMLLLTPAPGLEAQVSTREGRTIVLSREGDLFEAARHLFSALRELDGLDFLVAELPPEQTGIGHAIRDRLRKAGSRD